MIAVTDALVCAAWLCVIATGGVVACVFWTPLRMALIGGVSWIVAAWSERARKGGGR